MTCVSVLIRDFRVHGVPRSQDAQGESTIEVEQNGRVLRGRRASADTVEAPALSFLNALNRAKMRIGNFG